MLNKLQAMRKNLKKKGKGFTLVELIVVIIIIAIIAAVALPRIAAFQENARKSRIQSEHRQLVTAIQARISQSKNPSEEWKEIKSIEDVKAYMNVKSASGDLANSLAKDGENNGPAHVIASGKLTSTYTDPANKTGNDSKSETFEYDISPANQ
ncbi:prepilin-type N-terminal cleavage/methylation domain-containing protein [Streptococcus oricebi]|uniref:Prepilin-type cleavage/methylation domain-containing protein n=1 Tax=Streptococcus oricebi TaxID=1547447 RepID=A0ABS5B5R3_9STRE|nr:prepilin-type N-terminal cleavage/methylation domain-containing protein [Streptococcus oricebi]MBP2624182.1 prepilin-type cleavage/methylation domain-containing protein [Streptococcus oricebi]